MNSYCIKRHSFYILEAVIYSIWDRKKFLYYVGNFPTRVQEPGTVPHRTRAQSCRTNHLLSNILRLPSLVDVLCIGNVISVKSLTWSPFQVLPWLWLSCWVMPGPLLQLHFLTFPQSARSHIPWSWPNSQNLRSPANSTPIETEKLNPTSHDISKKISRTVKVMRLLIPSCAQDKNGFKLYPDKVTIAGDMSGKENFPGNW